MPQPASVPGRPPGGDEGGHESWKVSKSQQHLGPMAKGEKSEPGPREAHSLPGKTSCVHTERE